MPGLLQWKIHICACILFCALSILKYIYAFDRHFYSYTSLLCLFYSILLFIWVFVNILNKSHVKAKYFCRRWRLLFCFDLHETHIMGCQCNWFYIVMNNQIDYILIKSLRKMEDHLKPLHYCAYIYYKSLIRHD